MLRAPLLFQKPLLRTCANYVFSARNPHPFCVVISRSHPYARIMTNVTRAVTVLCFCPFHNNHSLHYTMPLTYPGTSIITGPAYLDNPRVQSGFLADSYFFDVTMRTFPASNENGYVLCSLSFKSAVNCAYMASKVYIITARVNLHPQFFPYGNRLTSALAIFLGRRICAGHAPPQPNLLQQIVCTYRRRQIRTLLSFFSFPCFTKLMQIGDTPLLPLHILLLHGSHATMTVAGYISTVDLNSCSFELNVSLRIRGVAGFALLTVRATFHIDSDDDENKFDMPRLHTLVCTTGFLVDVERRVAHMRVNHIASVPDYNEEMEDADVLTA